MTTARERSVGLLLLASSIVLSALGQLFMKAGMQTLRGVLSVRNGGVNTLSLAMLDGPVAWTVVGLIAYTCSLLIWLAVLVRYPLSFAYPLLGLSYVLVYVGATQWPRLAETATPLRTGGTLLILLGVALVVRPDEPE